MLHLSIIMSAMWKKARSIAEKLKLQFLNSFSALARPLL
jgi:hypothetical protein